MSEGRMTNTSMEGHAENMEIKDKRAVISEEIAIKIFAQRKPNSNFKTAESCMVANEYGVSSKSVRDVWDRRTWVKATMPLWTTAEVEEYEKRNKRPPGRPVGATDSKPRKRRSERKKRDSVPAKRIKTQPKKPSAKTDDSSSSSSSSSTSCYLKSSSSSASSSESGPSSVDTKHVHKRFSIQEAKPASPATRPPESSRLDGTATNDLTQVRPPLGSIETLLAGGQRWGPLPYQSPAHLLLPHVTNRPCLPLQATNLLPTSLPRIVFGNPYGQVLQDIVNTNLAQRISAANAFLMLSQACAAAPQTFQPAGQPGDR
eukprot:422830-Hanusia_phi.AAC.1